MKENNIELGKPTDYGYKLPKIRYDLVKKYLLNKGNILLDFGSGNGANTILFKDDFNSVIGIDVENDRVEESNNFLKKSNIKNISYKLYNGRKIPFFNEYFDSIVSFEVLEHTDNDILAIREVNRVLKKGGKFCLTVPNKWYLMETHGFNFPFSKFIPWNRMPFLSWLPRSIHSKYAKARIYTKKEIISKLKNNGFDIISFDYIMPPFDKIHNEIVRKIFQGIFRLIDITPFRCIGVSIFIVAQKNNFN